MMMRNTSEDRYVVASRRFLHAVDSGPAFHEALEAVATELSHQLLEVGVNSYPENFRYDISPMWAEATVCERYNFETEVEFESIIDHPQALMGTATELTLPLRVEREFMGVKIIGTVTLRAQVPDSYRDILKAIGKIEMSTPSIYTTPAHEVLLC